MPLGLSKVIGENSLKSSEKIVWEKIFLSFVRFQIFLSYKE